MKLITLNCEQGKHNDKMIAFIQSESPDVLCLQEVREDVCDVYSKLFSLPYYEYSHNALHLLPENNTYSDGIAILSRYPAKFHQFCYTGEHKRVITDESSISRYYASISRTLLVAEMKEFPHPIITTHFTWTPDGMPNDFQIKHLKQVLEILEKYTSAVLCGDFNIPRAQNNLYKKIINAEFVDMIPSDIVTSLDVLLHRVKDNVELVDLLSNYMVDYIFVKNVSHTPNVKQKFGVSDHSAFIAEWQNI